MNPDEFADDLCKQLEKLKTHDFISKQQSRFVKDLKETLLPDEFMMSCDFAENYALVAQNSTPSFHWNNNQATIFTVVFYYKIDNEIRHKSIAIISDNLTHDTAAVYSYQKIIINYLKKNYNVKKVYYITDGAGQQFKNKSMFANLLAHEKDFKITAECYFHATDHGKGACVGVGENMKRGAARASL